MRRERAAVAAPGRVELDHDVAAGGSEGIGFPEESEEGVVAAGDLELEGSVGKGDGK